MDLVALLEEEQLIQLWHCGPGPASLADSAGQSLTYHPTLDRASPPDKPRSGVASDIVLAPGPATVLRFGAGAESAFLWEADVVEGPTRGYAGSRGWLGNLRIGGEPAGVRDLIETIACYGLPHHYPLALGELGDAARELAAWAGIPVLARVAYSDYLGSPAARTSG